MEIQSFLKVLKMKVVLCILIFTSLSLDKVHGSIFDLSPGTTLDFNTFTNMVSNGNQNGNQCPTGYKLPDDFNSASRWFRKFNFNFGRQAPGDNSNVCFK